MRALSLEVNPDVQVHGRVSEHLSFHNAPRLESQ
jgi:hypothetical protein